MKHCQECNEATNHRVEYMGALLDTAFLPLAALQRRFAPNTSNPGRGKIFLHLYTALERLGMGQFLETPDDKTLLLDQVLWDEANRRGIVMREFRLFGAAKGLFIATLPSGKVIDFDGVPLPPWRAAWWINDKPKLVKELRSVGFPVANGKSVRTLRQAKALFKKMQTPLVVKPSVGSASRHTTMHISTQEGLVTAFHSAKKLSPWVMIEEELTGAVYRPTLVNGNLIAVLRRDQAFVTGDGTRTVRELVEEENKDPGRSGPYFSPVKLGIAAEAELEIQGLNKESIPAQGRRVQLNQKINWSLGGTTTDVADEVHPDNVKLFEDVAKLLHAPLVGIDFIIEDISRSWREQTRCGIIECNDMPYFDNHHLPYKGKPRNVAGPIWDLVLEN
jgi:D-alanine-D-alanine ligase-like ATP-grasp enzyme